MEDVDIEGSSCYDEASKHVVKRVSELIEVKMLKNGKLNGGQNDANMIEVGDIIAFNRSEDDRRQGIIFAKVDSKEGSDYIVSPFDRDESIKLPYQRI